MPNFDLDEYNGRWCVTPDYPKGTYAYFVANDASGNGTYPYVFGYEFYGDATGGTVTSINEAVTTNFLGGANAILTLAAPVVSHNIVTLTWSATEGGTYSVEVSSNLTTWTTNAAGIAAVFDRGTNTTPSVATNQCLRVTRTSLATYDGN